MDSTGMGGLPCAAPGPDGYCGAGFTASDSYSYVDSCPSPHSPYSPLSPPPPLSCLSNTLNAEAEPTSPFPHSVDEAVPVCYDFVQGRCARSNCKYVHDADKIEKTHSKKRGICFDHLRGDCNRGAMCRFSHDVSSFAQDYTVQEDYLPFLISHFYFWYT